MRFKVILRLGGVVYKIVNEQKKIQNNTGARQTLSFCVNPNNVFRGHHGNL